MITDGLKTDLGEGKQFRCHTGGYEVLTLESECCPKSLIFKS